MSGNFQAKPNRQDRRFGLIFLTHLKEDQMRTRKAIKVLLFAVLFLCSFLWSNAYAHQWHNIRFKYSDYPSEVKLGQQQVRFTIEAEFMGCDWSFWEQQQYLAYYAYGLPEGASFNPQTRTVTWTPVKPGLAGFSFNVRSSLNGSFEIRNLTINVIQTNHPPVLNPIGNKAIPEGQLLSFTVSATDPDNDSLTYSSPNLPPGASFDSSTRTFSWTPNFTQAGNYPNITFTVSDGKLNDSEPMSITVNNVNRAPTLSSIGNKTVSEGQLLSFSIQAQDQDTDDTLSYSAANLPTGANFNSSTRSFSWTPSPGQGGKDYSGVNFKVEDGKGGLAQEPITITVPSPQPNRPPVLNPIGPKSIKEGQALEFTVTATDLDNDPLTFLATPLPQGASFDPQTGKFKWTPGYDQAKDYKVRFGVSDGK